MDITDFKRQFGLRVQSQRRRRQLTQEEFAERIGRSTDTVSNIERGASSTRLETVFRIAEVLEVPPADFFDIGGKPVDHERRKLTERLLELIGSADAATLKAIIAQVEILLSVKGGGPTTAGR